jgi:lysozyme
MNFAALIQQLERHEGVRLKPYKDSVGKLTIGIGRNLDDVGISASEARTLLENDIGKVCAELDRALPEWRTWSENRQLAIADMCFNLGIGGVLKFKDMIANMKAGLWQLAALDALDSAWSKQVGERAKRISDMLRKG